MRHEIDRTTTHGRRTPVRAVSLAVAFLTVGLAMTPLANAATKKPAAKPVAFKPDTNGDGKVVIGVATPGPRNDGAYYQALVDGITAISKAKGYKPPIIVDNIKAADAATAIENLARQKVDIIAVGAGEIGDPVAALSAKYPKIFWYCNCGAGKPPAPGYAQAQDDSSEISFSAGYATGLLMKDKNDGKTTTAFIGNNNFAFEVEAFEAFKLGLVAVDPKYTMNYIPTGSFNDVPKATEAFNNAYAQGIAAVYPYLGGAHEAVVKLANDKGVIAMSAGSSKACARTDLKYDIAVRFDGGDYVNAIFTDILSGKLKKGDIRTFKVGVDPQPGAQICKPTAADTTAMADIYKRIAAGEFGDKFFAVKKKAYNF